jgi:hypothetical protein
VTGQGARNAGDAPAGITRAVPGAAACAASRAANLPSATPRRESPMPSSRTAPNTASAKAASPPK